MPTVSEFNKHPALARFTAFGPLDSADLAALFPLVQRSKRLRQGAYVQREGDEMTALYLLLDGWTASSMETKEAKRQLFKVHIAGDVIGLPGLPYREIPDTVVALTPVTVARIELKALGALFAASPRVAALLFMISQEERLMLMDRLFLVGRQEAASRAAGLLMQLYDRVLQRSPEQGNVLAMPLRQVDMADLLGITTVHMNRTFRVLHEQGLATWTKQSVTLHDLPALRELAGLPQRRINSDVSWLPPRTQAAQSPELVDAV